MRGFFQQAAGDISGGILPALPHTEKVNRWIPCRKAEPRGDY